MDWTGMRRASVRGVLLALLTLLATPTLAHARWLRAESNHFIVYSEGDEAGLRTYVETLETFDGLLRGLHGLTAAAQTRKLPIYLVRTKPELRSVVDLPETAQGVYLPTGEDIFAVAVSRGRQDDFLLHEYVHHFMLANFPYAYPAWLVEGYAEYFMTFAVEGQSLTWGKASPIRAGWLTNARWIPTATVLSRQGSELNTGRERAQFYAQSWVLTHYFLTVPGRRAQLDAYVKAVGAGEDSLAAMQKATGMTVDQLHATLRDYAGGRLVYANVSAAQFPPGPVAVTTLPASADDLLLLGQRLKVGMRDDSQRAEVAEQVRRAAARHPGDPLAALVLGHAEVHLGDPVAGERILLELLAKQPENVEALQYVASARLAAARRAQTPAEAARLRAQARGFLARAYKVDELNYQTLYLLAVSREPEPGYPDGNDMATWLVAYGQAPQLPAIRLGFARALMLTGEFDRAVRVLEPLANNPHGGRAAAFAQELMARAKERRPPTDRPAAEEIEGPPGAGDKG